MAVAVDYKNLGIRIREKRIALDMTQSELAERVGVTVQHISNVEHARTKISLEAFTDVVNALGCTCDELICGSVKRGRAIYQDEIAELIETFSDAELREVPNLLKQVDYFYRAGVSTGSKQDSM